MNKVITGISTLTIAAGMFATSAVAGDGPWQVRVRGLSVQPNESATISAIGGDVDINKDAVPELDITYFFNKHFAAELILATTNHTVGAVGTVAGDVPVGSVRLLPPTLTAQYHFTPDAKFSPYVGAGLNYTIFYDADAAGGVVTKTDYKNKFGVALQAGVDFKINDDWFFNVDVKKIFLKTNVDLTTAVGGITADVKLNPTIIGIGFGKRF